MAKIAATIAGIIILAAVVVAGVWYLPAYLPVPVPTGQSVAAPPPPPPPPPPAPVVQPCCVPPPAAQPCCTPPPQQKPRPVAKPAPAYKLAPPAYRPPVVQSQCVLRMIYSGPSSSYPIELKATGGRVGAWSREYTIRAGMNELAVPCAVAYAERLAFCYEGKEPYWGENRLSLARRHIENGGRVLNPEEPISIRDNRPRSRSLFVARSPYRD